MDDLNTCTVIGRLTRDVEVKQLRSGPVGNMSIAINKEIRKPDSDPQQKTTFVDLVLWGIPEKLAQYLTKGRQLAIRGEISTSSWDRDGEQYQKTYITVRELQLLSEPRQQGSPPKQQGHGSSTRGGSAKSSGTKRQAPPQPDRWQGPGPEAFDDDIPF